MDDTRERYRSTTLRILGNFQLLEFCLKVYVGLSYKIISHSLNGKLHFGYSASDVETFALERLLSVFAKLNADIALQKRLNKLREDRNHIAHESLLLAMGSNYDIGSVKEAEEKFFYPEDELADCIALIIEETKTLKGLFTPLRREEA